MSAHNNLSPHQFPIVEYGKNSCFSGQHYRMLIAHHKGAPADDENDLAEHQIGILSYVDRGTHVDVGNRRTHEDFRNQGVATALQGALERRFPGKPLLSDPDEMSDDAFYFHEAYKAKHPSSPWVLGEPGGHHARGSW